MAVIQRILLDKIILHFEALEDPRSTVNRQHPLASVVVIALMPVLAGARGPTEIAKWATLKEAFLPNALNLPNGIPRNNASREKHRLVNTGSTATTVFVVRFYGERGPTRTGITASSGTAGSSSTGSATPGSDLDRVIWDLRSYEAVRCPVVPNGAGP